MARLIYACRFEVPTENGLTPVLSPYSKWIEKKYQTRRGLPNFKFDLATDNPLPVLPGGHTIIREHFAAGSSEVLRVQWAHPADDDTGLEWRNEIRIGCFSTLCSVEHLISISSTDYRIMPAHLALGSPSVIRSLCSENAVQIGDMQVKATPYPLTGRDVPNFLALLQSPDRRLPIVFIAPYANGDDNVMDAKEMARHLAGVGIVVEVRDPEATWDIVDAIGRTLSCFDGGVRLYWPGFSTNDDQRGHRLYLGTTIESLGANVVARSIQRSVFAVAAFRFSPDPRISELIREAEQAQRHQRVEDEKASRGDDWEGYALELDERLSAATKLVSDLQAENANLKANQQVFLSARAFGEVEEDPIADETEPPNSVEAALERCKSTCNNVIILDSAYDAARKCPFQRPAEILSALTDLDKIAAEWVKQRKEQGSGGDLLLYLRSHGWGKRGSMHISNTTRTKHGSHYTFEYGGKRQLFEPHITIGSGDANTCASVHFILDDEVEKIIIAHVGRHLPNTKT